MRIRFLQTLDSGIPGYPFVPGQIIRVDDPPPWMLGYLDGEKAERLPDEDTTPIAPPVEIESTPMVVEEVALEPALPEVAVTKRGKRERIRRN